MLGQPRVQGILIAPSVLNHPRQREGLKSLEYMMKMTYIINSSVASGETQLTSIDDQKIPEKGLRRLTTRVAIPYV